MDGVTMCEFCDERGLPCLLCGRVTMAHKMDRERCGGRKQTNRPPREWPIFRFCPYCGRELELKNQGNNDEEGEEDTMKEKYTWTKELDYTARTMLEEGAPVEDICDKLGCTDDQLYRHIYTMRNKDRTYPKWPKKHGPVPAEAAEPAEESGPSGTPVPTEEESAEAGKGRLSDFEQELVAMIEEREERIRERDGWIKNLEVKLHELESKLEETQDKLVEFEGDAFYLNAEKAKAEKRAEELQALADKYMADAMNHEEQCLKRGDVILRMAERMFGEVSA